MRHSHHRYLLFLLLRTRLTIPFDAGGSHKTPSRKLGCHVPKGEEAQHEHIETDFEVRRVHVLFF